MLLLLYLRADGRVSLHGRFVYGFEDLVVIMVIRSIHRVDVVEVVPVVRGQSAGVMVELPVFFHVMQIRRVFL